MDLFVQCFDHVRRSVDRGPEFAPFSLPAADALVLSTPPSLLSIDLVANLALLLVRNGMHDKLHAASFARAIFPVAMLSEVTPFPVTARKPVHIKETHVSNVYLLHQFSKAFVLYQISLLDLRVLGSYFERVVSQASC